MYAEYWPLWGYGAIALCLLAVVAVVKMALYDIQGDAKRHSRTFGALAATLFAGAIACACVWVHWFKQVLGYKPPTWSRSDTIGSVTIAVIVLIVLLMWWWWVATDEESKK